MKWSHGGSTRGFAMLLAVGTSACTGGSNAIDATTDAATDAAHDGSSDGGFGTLTPRGPRVSGTNLGTMTVHGVMGTVFDSSGDGRPDEIDLDGDGISDGEDIDGDGNITIWSQLNTGERQDPTPERETPALDPSLTPVLDPRRPLRGPGVRADGTVNTLPAVDPPPAMMDVLTALSQGEQGSCAAWAVSAAAAIVRFNRESVSNPNANINALWPSPAWLYTRMIRSAMGACNDGTFINHGLDLLVVGEPASLAEQPYRSVDMPTLCEPTSPDPATMGHLFTIGSYNNISGAGMAFRDAVRRALSAGLPVVFGVSLPMGFMEFHSTTEGVDVTMPFHGGGMCPGSQHCGGHAMVIVGYDDARSAYHVLNSWGTDWGNRGYIWWDYTALESQPGLDGYELIALPHDPAPLGTPDVATLTVTEPMGARPVMLQVGGVEKLVVRVEFNDAVNLTNLTADWGTASVQTPLAEALHYGDLVFNLGATPPAAGTTVTCTVQGTLRDRAPFTKMFTVVAPAAM